MVTRSSSIFEQIFVGGAQLSDNGTLFTLLPLTGHYFRFGDAGTTSHSLAANDDALVSGNFEVDGTSWLDGLVRIGSPTTPDANYVLHLNTSTAGGGLRVTCANDGATGGNFTGHHLSASPADGDIIWSWQFNGQNSVPTDTTYGQIYTEIQDPTNGSMEAIIRQKVMINNSLTEVIRLDGSDYNASTNMAGPNVGIVGVNFYNRPDASYGGGSLQAVGTLQTTNDTQTTIATMPISEGDVFLVEVQIIGRKSDGTDRALYHLEGLFYRNAAGNVTQQGATVSVGTIESNANWDCQLIADTVAQAIDVDVTGVAGTTIDWKCDIKLMRVT